MEKGVLMKNFAKFLAAMRSIAIIAMVAVIGVSFAALSLTACDTGGSTGGSGAPTAQKVTYTGTAGDGTTYTLEITENTARYAAQSGDTYKLTVGVQVSIGTVSAIAGSTLTLKPSNATVTFTVTISGSSIIRLDGTVTWTGDTTPTTLPGDISGETPQLPTPVGNNELSGKTYDNGSFIISFDANNGYTLKARWSDREELFETGFYSWNATQKTATLVKDKLDTGDFGFGMQSKAEVRVSCIEYFSEHPDEIELPPGTTLEQYIDMMIEMEFSLTVYDYTIENGQITSFSIKIALSDNGSTIAGCAYTQKAVSGAFGWHYLLSVSFDTALSTLTAAYGQPMDGWLHQSNSTLTTNETDWVILEFSRYKDMRLTKSVAGYPPTTTTKGWLLNTNTP